MSERRKSDSLKLNIHKHVSLSPSSVHIAEAGNGVQKYRSTRQRGAGGRGSHSQCPDTVDLLGWKRPKLALCTKRGGQRFRGLSRNEWTRLRALAEMKYYEDRGMIHDVPAEVLVLLRAETVHN